MKTVFYEDYTGSEAYINPGDVIKPIENFPEVCISTFSKQIIDQFASMDNTETVCLLKKI